MATSAVIIAQVTDVTVSGVIQIGNNLAFFSGSAGVGDVFVNLVYTDRDVVAKGSCTSPALTQTINATLKKGWNYGLSTVTAVNGTQVTGMESTTVPNLPSNAKWIYMGPEAGQN
jgi:hypothetical protein